MPTMPLSLKPVAILFLASIWLNLVLGRCYEPNPAFPPPVFASGAPELKAAFISINEALHALLRGGRFPTSSYSIEVTSTQETLWSNYHTAEEKNSSRPDAPVVDGNVAFRIASITKVFTVLGIIQQHAAGNLSLDDTVDQHIPELKQNQAGHIPWKDITLRSLASQLSGIPNDWAQVDQVNFLPDPLALGLPPVDRTNLPSCDEYTNYEKPCSRKDLLDTIMTKEPLFPPNMQSTYSNTAFELLGLVIEKVTGVPYAEYITLAILEPLNMSNTSFAKPHDSAGAIPKGSNYWDVDEGVQIPTGGLYSTSSDMSSFLRHVLTHYNGLTPALNWLQPSSWAVGMQSFYGMPWEIFRTSSLLPHTRRPVTFAVKGGGLPGYFSNIIVMPEYNLGLTILVSGNGLLLSEIRDILTSHLTPCAELAAQNALHKRFAGTFVAPKSSLLNSSLTLSHTPAKGLYLESWISNGTDVLAAYHKVLENGTPSQPWYLQLIPTQLYVDNKRQRGEKWRAVVVSERQVDSLPGVWEEYCITHIDNERYGGVPLNEIIFWQDNDTKGPVAYAELTAFRIMLGRHQQSRVIAGSEEVVLQNYVDL